MPPVSRRGFLASGTAGSVAFAQRTANSSHAEDSPEERRLLASRTSAERLRSALLPRERWTPFPPAADRSAWEQLPVDARSQLIHSGEQELEGGWPIPKASLFLEYVRNGNRSNYERELSRRRERLKRLVVAECAEGKGRFLDEIANGVWSTCEETWWGYPAHMGLQRQGSGLPDVTEPVIDLFAAEAAAQLAWTHYLLAPQLAQVQKLVPERIEIEIDRRTLVPYRARTDFWWMGLEPKRAVNNWNPWINSNCLTCILLMERDEAKRAEMVQKVIRSVDRFLDAYDDDGGCDEGPSYWGRAGGSLFDNLELLYQASNGGLDFYSIPLVQQIGRYIYRVHIADDWYVNFADASARVRIAGDLVYRYGKRIGDANMQSLGAGAAQRDGLQNESLGRFLPALFNLEAVKKAPARQPLVRDTWLPGIQVMTARTKDGSKMGLYLAAQGGHNAESHNHNDVGNFIVYSDGEPAIVDVGVETYSAKTFSSKRYEIWTMQSAYHNLPTINGVMQAAGRRFAARNVSYQATDAAVSFTLDISAAYPSEAGVETWQRGLRFDRVANAIEVRDTYVLQKPGGRVELSLMTPYEVKQSGAGELTVACAKPVRISFPELLSVAVEERAIGDARLKPVWGTTMRRILLKAQNLPAKGEFLVRIRQA